MKNRRPLRIEADIENGKIKDAYSSGTMVRLLEEILKAAIPGMHGPL